MPRYFSAAEANELVTWTRDQDLEGVVAKRLDSGYRPGRRSAAWVKMKHRRVERFLIGAWKPGDPGAVDEYLLMRPTSAGFAPAGTASLGLDHAGRERLRAVLHALETRAPRRGRPRRVEPHVALLVSVHGPRGRPVRDPMIAEVCWPEPTGGGGRRERAR